VFPPLPHTPRSGVVPSFRHFNKISVRPFPSSQVFQLSFPPRIPLLMHGSDFFFSPCPVPRKRSHLSAFAPSRLRNFSPLLPKTSLPWRAIIPRAGKPFLRPPRPCSVAFFSSECISQLSICLCGQNNLSFLVSLFFSRWRIFSDSFSSILWYCELSECVCFFSHLNPSRHRTLGFASPLFDFPEAFFH